MDISNIILSLHSNKNPIKTHMNTTAIAPKNTQTKKVIIQHLKTLKVKTDSIVNFLDLATTPLEPMQVKRKIVTLRTFINRLMRTPQRIENVELRPLIVETDYEVEDNNETIVQTYTSKLGGVINTRIETYKNKQVVRVFANIDDRFLRSI